MEPTIIKDVGTGWGVYFLFLDKKIQYVGKSKNVWSRFQAHIGEFEFNRVVVFPCPHHGKMYDDWLLKEIEAKLIFLYCPPKNTQHCRGEFHHIPFSEKLEKLINETLKSREEEGIKEKTVISDRPKSDSLEDVVIWVIQSNYEIYNLVDTLEEGAE